MRILGAILAGGQARRFGSDKAAALLSGKPLIAHVREALAGQCDAVAVVGREWPGITAVADLPAPGLGPLGALAGALAHAERHGFDAVLTSGCDMPGLPADLAARLAPGPAIAEGQPLLGLWPAALAAMLRDHLERGGGRAVRAWAAAAGARRVTLPVLPPNINRPEDLAALAAAIRPPADPRSSR